MHSPLHNYIPERMALDNDTGGKWPGEGAVALSKCLRRKAAIMGKEETVQVENSLIARREELCPALSYTAVNPKLFS